MAVDKLVDSAQLDADLEDVADAIRAKGGTSAVLAFPAGFVSAVEAIQTGITPTGTKQISITQNGTVTEDVTAYAAAEIAVNVSGGGGSSYTLLHRETWEDFSFTGTTAAAVGTITLPGVFSSGKTIYVKIRRSEYAASHFIGADNYFASFPGSTSTRTALVASYRYATTNPAMTPSLASASTYGICARTMSTADVITLYARYQSTNSGTIAGTYIIEVYELDWPNGDTPWMAP